MTEAEIRMRKLQASEGKRLSTATRSKGRIKEEFSPEVFRRRRDLLTPWFWPSSFPNCKIINVCCIKAARLWCFVTGALRTNTPPLQNPPRHRPLLVTSFILKVKVLVSQSCPTLGDPMDCSPPGSSVHGILQARMLEWVAISSSRGSSLPRTLTQFSCIAGKFFTVWATREASFVLNNGLFPRMQRWKIVAGLLKKSAYFVQFGRFGIAGHDSRWKPRKGSFDFLQHILSNNSCIVSLFPGLQDTLQRCRFIMIKPNHRLLCKL